VKLQFLGSGAAFTHMPENFQSNMLLQAANGNNLLIDCGSDARHSLDTVGLTSKDIDGVYVSHLHADHVGGLEWLAFTTYFDMPKKRPKLFIHPDLLERLWCNVLSGGLQSLEGAKSADLNDFFEIIPCEGGRFIWEGVTFQLIQTKHVFNGPALAPSYGLYFTTPQSNIFITTDTQFMPKEFQFYFEEATLIFHDCDTGVHKNPVHTHFSELLTLPKAIRQKIWLYHYQSKNGINPVEDDFLGFVERGQTFQV